jgi:hypothetical protein
MIIIIQRHYEECSVRLKLSSDVTAGQQETAHRDVDYAKITGDVKYTKLS